MSPELWILPRGGFDFAGAVHADLVQKFARRRLIGLLTERAKKYVVRGKLSEPGQNQQHGRVHGSAVRRHDAYSPGKTIRAERNR